MEMDGKNMVDVAKPGEDVKKTGNPRRSNVPKMGRLIGIKIQNSGMVYRFFNTARHIKVDDVVLLFVNEEEIIGSVVYVTEEGTKESFEKRIFVGGFDPKSISNEGIRVLSENEKKFFDLREERERQARIFCREKIREMQLPMKISKVNYVLIGNKAVFYFTAENRVDFRELVRILGGHLKVRVEMRHIGVRDETKVLGGMGVCGNEFCCSKYLTKFHPVSVRMAKNQELSLNPDGISGACGRLLCCLEYENATYQILRGGLPKIKKPVQTLDGREGTVYAVYPLREAVGVQFGDGSRACVSQCDLCAKGAAPHQPTSAVVDHPKEYPKDKPVALSGGTSVEKLPDASSTPATRSSATTNRRRRSKRAVVPHPSTPPEEKGSVSVRESASNTSAQRPAVIPTENNSEVIKRKKRHRRRRSHSSSSVGTTPAS